MNNNIIILTEDAMLHMTRLGNWEKVPNTRIAGDKGAIAEAFNTLVMLGYRLERTFVNMNGELCWRWEK